MAANEPVTDQDSPEPLTTEEVLRAEFQEIWGEPVGNTAQYRKRAFEAEQAALCLSGGGIRSAAFALGVLQALAKKGLLTRFHYLSTVSGGGYVGGWLQRWIHEKSDDAAAVEKELAAAGGGSPEVQRLRENSNFLTPSVGIASADTWTAIALSVRNILINWLIFGPALLLAVLLPNLYRQLIELPQSEASPYLLVAGALLLAYAVYFGARSLPSHAKTHPPGPVLFRHVAVPALVWALLATAALAPVAVGEGSSRAVFFGEAFLVPLLAMFGGYVVATLIVPPEDKPSFRRNFLTWMAAAFVSALALCLVFLLMRRLPWFDNSWRLDILACLGPLLVIIAHLLLSVVFAAFRRTKAGPKEKRLSTDLDREWLGRLSAIKLRPALAWALLALCALVLPRLILDHGGATLKWITGVAGTVSGILTVFGGKSSAAGLGPASAKKRIAALSMDAVVGLATLVFAAVLFMLLSRLEVQVATALVVETGAKSTPLSLAIAHFALLVILALLLWRASSRINVNRFSLNGLYRNRIARAFFGAARASRIPDPFTGFAPSDNVRMEKLRPRAGDRRVLMPVVNVALNVVSSDRLAWQERKAEPFVITPIASGSALLDLKPPGASDLFDPTGAYVPTARYGGNEPDLGLDGEGISLATAVTISGAAASPAMGYHSSPATAFLMTLFNVRLGAWLPNPARARELKGAISESGPTNSLRPLMAEIAGLTNDKGFNVYLSDGGHFENLGLYEMVRRRCAFIVVSDAGCDPECGFADLGNAVRKIMIDQDGIEISFEELHVRSRKDRGTEPQLAYALGRIRYSNGSVGRLLYIKPSYFGTKMPLDVRAYAKASENFPHEPTSDQWFSESQFESYRHLGEWLTQQLGRGSYGAGGLREFFDDVKQQQREYLDKYREREAKADATPGSAARSGPGRQAPPEQQASRCPGPRAETNSTEPVKRTPQT
jgi:hypothetical protein